MSEEQQGRAQMPGVPQEALGAQQSGWRELTEPDRLSQWFGPRGFTMTSAQTNLRPNKPFHYSIRSKSNEMGGKEMWGSGGVGDVGVSRGWRKDDDTQPRRIPELRDIVVSRSIKAPRERVWRAPMRRRWAGRSTSITSPRRSRQRSIPRQ